MEKRIYIIFRKGDEIKYVTKGTQKEHVNWMIMSGEWVVIGEIEISGDLQLSQFLQLHELRLKTRIAEYEESFKIIKDSIPCL